MINAGPLSTDRHGTAVSWQRTCPTCEASAIGDGMDASCGHRDSYVVDVAVDDVAGPALDIFRREIAMRISAVG